MCSSSLEYDIENSGDTEVHTILWSICNLFQRFTFGGYPDQAKQEVCSDQADCSNAKVEPRDRVFKIKIILNYVDATSIEIYYSSAMPVVILNWHVKLAQQPSVLSWYDINHGLNIPIGGVLSIPREKWMPAGWHIRKSGDGFLNLGLLDLKLIVTTRTIEPYRLEQPKEVEDDSFSSAFEKLLNSDFLSDITIKSVEGDEFKVHKVLLASRSAVLKAHFEHDTIECRTNCVESPLHSEVLKEIISFIYTNKAQRLNEIPEKLLPAADYYDLKKLKYLCEVALLKKLAVNNAIDTLQLAELHSASILIKESKQFIKSNLQLIVKSDSWKKSQSVELLKSIVESIAIE